ncbi:MAG: Ribonuclease BN [Phycisphaerae bacterium]|nr:Ribonuclease BN [Phycisphaerae bacterium]
MPTPLIEKRVSEILLLGYSMAGEETVIAAPELNVCFDIGKAPAEVLSCDHLCLSHGHPDHAAGLHYYFTQRYFLDNTPGTCYLPEHLLEPAQDLMQVWARIEGRYTQANLVVARPGEDIPIRKDLLLRPFQVNHGVPALGFAVVEVRHKLRPEYNGLTGPQLVELKKQGQSIDYQIEIPLIAYCGDTAVGDFLDLDHVRNAKVLLLECTFFDDEHVSRARAGKHIHIHDLPKIMPRLRNPHIVLFHQTRRTFIVHAKQQLAELLSPTDRERVVLLMDRPRKPRPE